MRLKDKTVLITGATAGIGEACANEQIGQSITIYVSGTGNASPRLIVLGDPIDYESFIADP